ncbi:heme oxygenase (biliverdin-producing) [Paractinoplanes toevensis]|uniref:Heme oxygenase n=1 Tax=Paractinoplanes toevensis TaxID=571911 RepID=A0A919W2L0_9ACTN|nr:biliverdin-producing heme oxygenase [Actinoplanes toevensis]GIM93722.1 heme oxygenase [Actinoplanes toevensis]
MTGFAARLRKATMVEHREAETRSFISRLMAGSVPRAGFAALTAQYLIVYRELEAAAEAMRGNEIAAPFADPALNRVPLLEADLAHLGGSYPATAAAQRYADHLRAHCPTSPEHFIAHHYVRYLGDLSGGLLVGKKVAATYGLHDGGVSFYDFDHIADPKSYKIAYRERLDALPLPEERLSVLIAEAQHAFSLNGAVFQELGAAYPEEISPAA